MTKKKQEQLEKIAEPKTENINNPIGKWKIGTIELTKWLNIDEKTGHEWSNYCLKKGRKDTKTGQWSNDEIRFNEQDLSTMRDVFDMAIQDTLRKRMS